MTKEHIERVIQNNRRGIAAHQLYVESQKELAAEKARADRVEACAAEMRSALMGSHCGHSCCTNGYYIEFGYDQKTGAPTTEKKKCEFCHAVMHALSSTCGTALLEERKRLREALEAISDRTNTCVQHPDRCKCSQHIARRALRLTAALKEGKP